LEGNNVTEAQMSIFNEREKSFEKRFALEEELRFKATARRNHLVGLWAAKELGLTDAAADDYAGSIVTTDLDNPHSDVVLEKLRSDFSSHDISIADHKIRSMMNDFMTQALEELRR
jgi:hypothetical protein